ncbi:unnamed protein product [Protopolystoma xenopodis]|uniref:Uncharacterized protein n=1 Tax=Protopolystoma xenopodis TaxID=117903 RepID=A0A448WZZ8_9PLAT|nr:unnamed protein product [Protopolystoma xenopodis]
MHLCRGQQQTGRFANKRISVPPIFGIISVIAFGPGQQEDRIMVRIGGRIRTECGPAFRCS